MSSELLRMSTVYLHRRHGHVSLSDLIAVLDEAGLQLVDSGTVGTGDLNFVLAKLSCCSQ